MDLILSYLQEVIGKDVKTRAKKFAKLRKTLPEIKALESLDELKDLELVNHSEDSGMVVLVYKALSDKYVGLKQDLIKSGAANKNNIEDSMVNGRRSREYQFSHYKGKLQIILDVKYKPKI